MITVAYYKNKGSEIVSVLKQTHKETMITCCFDCLMTKQKVACEVYPMSALYDLGTEINWIHPELKTIIEANIHQKSPAYNARGKHILEQITKFKPQSIT